MDNNNEMEIQEIENYSGSKGEAFSHGQLIMLTMKKCIDAGCKEMKEGYYNTKSDKYGNINYIYVPDTRKEFIEAIETLQMVMADDINDDSKTKTEIGNVKGALTKAHKNFCKLESEDWKKMHELVRQKYLQAGIYFRKDMLSKELPYSIEYLMKRVEASRKVFNALTKLTKRKDYYREEMVEA